MRYTPKILSLLVKLVMVVGLAQTSHATLADVGPVHPTNGFPVWYLDGGGVSLEQCNFSAVSTDPKCKPAVPALNPIADLDFEEAFWWSAEAAITDPAFDAQFVLALEASFQGVNPAQGKQVVRSRLRIRSDIPAAGQYTVTHPFGEIVYNVSSPGRRAIDDTIEIGGGPLDFVTVLGSDNIGPFLKCAVPAPPAGYIGNYPSSCTVTGSPFSTNEFRILGPSHNVSTNMFKVSGKLYAAAPIPFTVDKATYRCPASGKCTIDVWATSSPGAVVKITDPQTPRRFQPKQLQGDGGGKFFGSVNVPATTVFPTTVKITSDDLINAPVTKKSGVREQVEISAATFNVSTGICTISAASSDQRAPLPTLTVTGYGDLAGGTYTFKTAAPPPVVTVTSSKGGQSDKAVRPVGVTDTVQVTSAVYTKTPAGWDIRGTGSSTGATIDIYRGGIIDPAQQIGTVTVQADKTWTFTSTLPRLYATTISVQSSRGGQVLNKALTVQ